MKLPGSVFVVVFILAVSVSASAFGPGDSAVTRCRSISPSSYQTVLIFNPPHLQTMYDRSECLQNLAVRLRDEALCSEVRERKSLFFDGSGISGEACLKRVKRRVDDDRLAAGTIQDIQRLKKVSFGRNGNGRDLDMRVLTRGRYAHSYKFQLIWRGQEGAVVLFEQNLPLAGSDQSLTLLLRSSELRRKLGDRWPMKLNLQAVLSLEPGSSDEAAVFSHIPLFERTSVVNTVVHFPAVVPHDPGRRSLKGEPCERSR